MEITNAASLIVHPAAKHKLVGRIITNGQKQGQLLFAMSVLTM